MHELSVALSLLDVASEQRRRLGDKHILAIHVKVGALAGVSKSALLSAYELAREASELSDARLVVEDVPIVGYCAVCAAERPVQSPQMLCCTVCGTPAARIIRGNELQLTALEIDA